MTALEQLPARMDAIESQFSQLREEMHAEFSAVREEIRAGDEETRRVLRDDIRVLRDDTRDSTEKIMSQARTLYEDMKAALALTEDGRPIRRKRR